MSFIKKYIYAGAPLAATLVGLLAASLANAQSTLSAPTNVITSATDITNLFCGVVNWLFWGLIVLSIAMFLIGGYLYASSGGDAEKVGKATRTLTYAAIGIVVALVAVGVPYFIGSFLNNNASLFSNPCSS